MAVIESIPDIDVPWEKLGEAAAVMRDKASSAISQLDAASAAWDGLQQAYKESHTQDRVYAALTDLRDPAVDWAVALSSAAAVLEDFAVTGKPLQQEAETLKTERTGLLSRTASSDIPGDDEAQDALNREVSELNERVLSLQRNWSRTVETAVSDLSLISGGTGDTLPVLAALGGPVLPSPDWIGLTSTLDDFGELDPAAVAASLIDLNEEELREWAKVNPEAALLLSNNNLPEPPPPGSAEAAMLEVMNTMYDRPRGTPDLPAHLAAEGIRKINEAWGLLSEDDQKRLLLLYPAVFGNLNGVPMAQRARANTVTAAGYREELTRQLAAMGEGDGRSARGQEIRESLTKKKQGLDHVINNDLQAVMVNIEADGSIVTMNGTPSPRTRTSTLLVPGTEADLASVGDYTGKLADLTAGAGADDLSFYWQGADLPDKIGSNATGYYNTEGGRKLAAFDAALDLELPSDAATTGIGYSAGAAMLGTAERMGLDIDNVIYLAPSGVGEGVSSVENTTNPDANRYWIQSRDDSISLAQWAGGIFQGADPNDMGVTRLESGFINHDDGGEVVGGHTEYFRKDSTAMRNMRGVIYGQELYPFVPYEPDNYVITEGGVVLSNPLEETPEVYKGDRMHSIPGSGK